MSTGTLEFVRLIIWDLDDTFWSGTLVEGNIRLIPSHVILVKHLALRGIISSICSKNDFSAVKQTLSDAGIWDFFVMPSINWEPKAHRIQALIESFQLRPASVLFVDDNHSNREEARFLIPTLQIADRDVISEMDTSPAFAGKPDPTLARLNQYKLLEQRKSRERLGADNPHAFLRQCHIEVEIEPDIAPHLPRAIELINRTNQLNFLKARLPDNVDEANKELTTLLQRHDIQAGLIRVSDRYGDHGYCGIYIQHQTTRQLLQYAFSCRILGLGVERWLYDRLGRPPIQVNGDVLVNLWDDKEAVDWIKLATKKLPRVPDTNPTAGSVFARGGCDLQAISHYFDLAAFESIGEFNLHRNGCDARVDHSIFLRYALTGVPDGGIEAAKELGYLPEDFHSAIRATGKERLSGQAVWLLSFWTDASYALYRDRTSGIFLPFMVPGWSDHTQDATAITQVHCTSTANTTWIDGALKTLRTRFEYVGPINEALFKENLKIILESATATTRIFILGANEHLWDEKANVRHFSSMNKAINDWTRDMLKRRRNATLLSVRDFITSDAEVHDWGHFDRLVYFRIFRCIEHHLIPQQLPL